MTKNNNKARYAVITGGTKGIGKALCHKLASQGCDIATCSRNEDELQALQKDLADYSTKTHIFKIDLSDRQQTFNFAKEIGQLWSRVDLLINNAGIFLPGSILGEPNGQLEDMMNANLYSAYHLTRSLMPLIRKGDKAHIFNMCSIASKIAYPNGGSYSITKFALLGFSKVLREELKESSIRVTAILPGATWSDSWKNADFPRSRLMEADDIAHLVWSAYELSATADVEEIIVRPQLGDL